MRKRNERTAKKKEQLKRFCVAESAGSFSLPRLLPAPTAEFFSLPHPMPAPISRLGSSLLPRPVPAPVSRPGSSLLPRLVPAFVSRPGPPLLPCPMAPPVFCPVPALISRPVPTPISRPGFLLLLCLMPASVSRLLVSCSGSAVLLSPCSVRTPFSCSALPALLYRVMCLIQLYFMWDLHLSEHSDNFCKISFSFVCKPALYSPSIRSRILAHGT